MKKENVVNKKFAKGFTLIELLVVVLIIGILAGIALPQYKLAVAKSKFNTLKNVTKSLKESVDRYYLANGARPTKFEDLDIDLKITKKSRTDFSFYISFSGVTTCEIYYKNEQSIFCKEYIAGKLMMYNNQSFPGKKRYCITYSVNKTDITNKVCQSETGKTASQVSCSDNYCIYTY